MLRPNVWHLQCDTKHAALLTLQCTITKAYSRLINRVPGYPTLSSNAHSIQSSVQCIFSFYESQQSKRENSIGSSCGVHMFHCSFILYSSYESGAAEANFKWGGWRYWLMIFIIVLIKHIHVHMHYCHIKYTCKLFKICQSISFVRRLLQ